MNNVFIISLSIITVSNIFIVFILRDIFNRLGALCGMFLENNPKLIEKAKKGDFYLKDGSDY